MIRRFCFASAVTLFVLIWAPAVHAEGGKSIATATPVAVGQLMTGNTANGAEDSEGMFRSWWALNVTAGDTVTIDWSSDKRGIYGSPTLNLFAVGVTDFNFSTSNRVATQRISATLRSQLTYKAPTSGTMPLQLFTTAAQETGPYSFTVRIAPAPCPEGSTGAPPNCVAVDSTPPRIYGVSGKLISGRVRVAFTLDEYGASVHTLYVGGRRIGAQRATSGPGSYAVSIRLGSRATRALRAAHRRGRKLTATWKVSVHDNAGNTRLRTYKFRI